MSEVRFDCPWCGIKGGGFASESEYSKGLHENNYGSEVERRFITYRCRKCSSALVALYENLDPHLPQIHGVDGDPVTRGWKLLSHYPSAPIADPCPEHVPERVKKRFQEATDNFQGERWDSAGTMYRKTLDVATKALIRSNWPEAEAVKLIDKWLKPRIQILKGKDIITPALAEWANDIIIEEGNDAAHEEEPFTKEQSEALHYFTRLFLTYAYELPQEVKLHSEKPDNGENMGGDE